MSAALARHDEIIEDLVAQHGGHVVRPRGEGDSRFAVFARASDAVAGACALQIALLEEDWPFNQPLQVRMAVHTGEAEIRQGDYYGQAVNHCARLRAIAHGGQVLVSAVTADLVREALTHELTLRDLGHQQLTDLDQPERVWQLLHPRLPSDFPPLRSATARRDNLPNPLTSFVGRQDDLAQLHELLRATRLLTITGSGGCGKTRLALEVGRQVSHEFHDGVWLVDLAPVSEPLLVWNVLATVLRIRNEPVRPLVDAVTDYLRDRSSLIILDNCEHLIDAAARTADGLMRETAKVRVLATSRELLGVPGEAAWRVRSLSYVDPDDLVPSLDAANVVLASEAGRLFVDRARLLNPTFELTADNVRAVAQICKRLDGIPLAIELAAARLPSLSVDDLASRLDHRFRLLTGGYRTAVPRQQTLRATVDWSYELLSEPERALLRSLSVFAGGWSLEAAEAVASAAATGSAYDVLDLLNQLVRKSMVATDEMRGGGGANSRYRFLETIRQYAEEKLVAYGEAEAARTRHCNWYVRLAEEAELGMQSSHQRRWWDLLEMELDNLRAALTWLAAQPDGNGPLLHVAGLLGLFWRARGHMPEAIRWLEMAVLRSHASAVPSADLARAQTWLAMFHMYNGDTQRAEALLEESTATGHQVDDARLLSLIMRHRGLASFAHGDYERAGAALEEALQVSREAGIKREIAWNLGVLAENVIQQHGDPILARRLLDESIATGRDSGDLLPVVWSMTALAHLHVSEGDNALAREILKPAIEHAREIGIPEPFMDSSVAVLLGDIATAEHDWEAAVDLYHQALHHARRAGTQPVMAQVVLHYAGLLSVLGDQRASLRFLAASKRFHIGLRQRLDRLAVDEKTIMSAARSTLAEREFAAAWAEGESITIVQASDEILEQTRYRPWTQTASVLEHLISRPEPPAATP